MLGSGMELRHLRYFVAVAEEENVTRAALRLHVSQPPLSRQIRDLEEELRVELFKRTAKSLSLTEAGKVFLAEARAVLERAEEAVQAARATAAGGEGEIQVGYAPSPTGEFLSWVLNAFERRKPGVRVVLRDLTSVEMLAGLRAKRLHAALVVEHIGVLPAGLKFERLRSYRVGVILPKHHRLARRRVLRLDDVLGEPMAGLSRTEYGDYHTWLRSVLGKSWKKLRIVEECDGAMSLMTAVESGRAIAISAESIMSVAGDRFVFVRLAPAPEPLHVGVCFPASAPDESATKAFVEAARSVAARL
jgi:DNA-binding transcriptional LysR family regulator